MIHFTVAAPLGIDSLFFSFVQRLAAENGHPCVDPPAEGLDGEQQDEWIDLMRRSRQHHFVVGYRYPPRYWSRLVDEAASTVVLCDGDGITRQIEQIQRQEQETGGGKEMKQCLEGILHAVGQMVELTERLLKEESSTRLLPPALAFQKNPEMAFKRLEKFYQEAGVPLTSSCWHQFSIEAEPLFNLVRPASPNVRNEILALLSLEETSLSRLQALEVLLGERV